MHFCRLEASNIRSLQPRPCDGRLRYFLMVWSRFVGLGCNRSDADSLVIKLKSFQTVFLKLHPLTGALEIDFMCSQAGISESREEKSRWTVKFLLKHR